MSLALKLPNTKPLIPFSYNNDFWLCQKVDTFLDSIWIEFSSFSAILFEAKEIYSKSNKTHRAHMRLQSILSRKKNSMNSVPLNGYYTLYGSSLLHLLSQKMNDDDGAMHAHMQNFTIKYYRKSTDLFDG